MEHLVKEITKREGVTEALKRADPMTWVGPPTFIQSVGLMNSCKAQAEEIILAELIYI